MSPRQPITAVPYANNAATLDGLAVAAFSPTGHSHDFAEITGNVPYIDSRITELQSIIDTQQEQLNLLLQTLTPEELGQLSTKFTTMSTQIEELETSITSRNVIDELVPFISVDGNDVILTGANLHHRKVCIRENLRNAGAQPFLNG